MTRIKRIVAVLLIALGIAGFAYQGIRLLGRETEPRHVPLSPIIGVVALIVGIALLLTDDGKSRHRYHGRSS